MHSSTMARTPEAATGISPIVGLRAELEALRELGVPALASAQAHHSVASLLQSSCLRMGQLLDQIENGHVPSHGQIWIDARAFWFRVGDGPTINLRRRRSLRQMLNALASSPRVPISSDALMAAGWDDERVLPNAASARVRTAIATLRRLGLRELLVTTGDGYMLDADVIRV
jgi:DNA-binding response OmpR family regulator